jgi:hypothetical protein
MVALDCYMAAETIQAMIEVAHPTYVPVKWHGTLLTIAMALVTLAFNTLLSGHLSICEGMFAICHFFAFAPIAATLFIMAPNRPVREVFLEFTDHGGWPHIGLSVLIGQVSNMFVVLGCDVITHMAEDIDDPATVLPQCTADIHYGSGLLLQHLLDTRGSRLNFSVRCRISRLLWSYTYACAIRGSTRLDPYDHGWRYGLGVSAGRRVRVSNCAMPCHRQLTNAQRRRPSW